MSDIDKKTEEKLDQIVANAASEVYSQGPILDSRKGFDASGLKETLINYIVPLVSLILSLLIGLFILYPSYKSLPELKSQYETKRLLKSNLENKLATINKLVDFKRVVDENSDLVSRVLVSEQLVPGLLTQVDKIARESGFNISRLNYGLGTVVEKGTEGAVAYNYVAVNLGANGSLGQLKTFLKSIESAARIVNVDTFRFSLNEDVNGSYLGINFVLVSPYLFVESNAVTDEMIDLDITKPDFVDLINKIKNLKYYDPNDINVSVPVVEAPIESDESGDTTVVAGPAELKGTGEVVPAETPTQ